MRSLVAVVCVLALVAISAASTVPYPNGCRYVNGHCYEACPEGTHSYTVGCAQKMPEPTCSNPSPQLERGILCDYSSCYCNPPTVRNEQTNKCVQLSDCPPLPSDPVPEQDKTETETKPASEPVTEN